MAEQENIVKKVCRELGITQKELAERLGTHLTTVQKWVSSDELPNSVVKSIELLVENENLKSKLNKFQSAFNLIDEARG
jgi:DNA-binding transcriptional regulator YiaG